MKRVEGLPWGNLLTPLTEHERARAAAMTFEDHLDIRMKVCDAASFMGTAGDPGRDAPWSSGEMHSTSAASQQHKIDQAAAGPTRTRALEGTPRGAYACVGLAAGPVAIPLAIA